MRLRSGQPVDGRDGFGDVPVALVVSNFLIFVMVLIIESMVGLVNSSNDIVICNKMDMIVLMPILRGSVGDIKD